MRNVRPIYVMFENGITKLQLEALFSGISEVLCISGVLPYIEVVNFGVWCSEGWRAQEGLVPFRSIYWYIQKAREMSSRQKQVNGGTIINLLQNEPWRQVPHYDIVVLCRDMYSGENNNNFVIGIARPELGTVVSVHRFSNLEPQLQAECIKTKMMHELGHVFDLIPDDRWKNVEESLGKHCTNLCIMRQGLSVPSDWIATTRDRLQRGPLCPQCQEDLQRFFR